ncbi:MAG: DHH family phosphoesterase, partial [Planctomycetota bacterium]
MSETLMKDLVTELGEAKTVVITAHDRPDGDALGAVLGLARILRQHGNTVHLAGTQPVSAMDAFLLTKEEHFEPWNPAWAPEESILVVLDCASAERAEVVPAALEAGMRALVIDHHISNQRFGAVNWIDADASSACEMILQLADFAGWEVLPDAAEALWVGIVTDTGRYTYENTSPATLRAGARLVELGAVPSKLGEKLFQNRPLHEVQVTGRAIQSLEMHYEGQM